MSKSKYIATVTTDSAGEMFVGVFDTEQYAKNAVHLFLKDILNDWEPAFGFSETWNKEIGNTQCHVSKVTLYSGSEYTG